MKMVERLARAMAERNWPGASKADIDEMWESWTEEAQAALRALENPTPAMIDRFVSRALQVKIGGGYTWSDYARDQWQTMLQGAYHDDAMIAAAREE
jgi:hypothetical protein